MKLKALLDHLDAISPFATQEGWDNSGLQVGDKESEVTKVVLALELSESLIAKAEPGSCFVVHHPLIFGKQRSIDFAKFPDKLIAMLIQKNQSCIALHTNFDKSHLNAYVFGEVLGFDGQSDGEFLMSGECDLSLSELVKKVKSQLSIEHLRVVNPLPHIKSVALCTGSGASMIDSVKAQCFLTGDIKYHDAIKAKEQGLMMIDIGHYESEHFFAQVLKEQLEVLPNLAIIEPSDNPFIWY